MSELLTSVFLLTYIIMTDVNDNNTSFQDICGLFLVGTLFVALGFSVLVMLFDIYKTLRQMVRKVIYKCRIRKAKKTLDGASSSSDLEDTVRAPIVRKKSEKLEEIREVDGEEEDEDGVVKDVSFETENQEGSARVDIKPVVIMLSHNSAVPKVEI